MKFVEKNLSDLKESPYNPRKISKQAKIGLSESLERFGLVQHVIYNVRTGNIVGGHQRYKFMKEKNVEKMMVVEVDLDDLQEKSLNIELNNTAIQGEWSERIESLLNQVKNSDKSLFDRLKFDDLEDQLDRSAGINMQCPCCQYKWQFKSAQARIANQDDIEKLNDSKAEPIPPPTPEDQKEIQEFAAEMSAQPPKEESKPTKKEDAVDKAFDFSDGEDE